jgi:uncharacterized protein (DUF1800 family)
VGGIPSTDAEAARFLQQATMGYKPTDVARVRQIGYAAWIDEQFALAQQFSFLTFANGNPTADVRSGVMNPAAYQSFALSSDQLRQRTMWALSQIMVVSSADGNTYYWGRAFAKYADLLQQHGFGSHRSLLEAVARSPAMGAYLSHMYNRKEDPSTGSIPDQNFARELMQLFSIGLWELNIDGSRKLDAAGNPIPTYTQADVIGVSRVMTGWAPQGATATDWDNYYCFCQETAKGIPGQSNLMVGYNQYHSTLEKRFLGVTIPAGSSDAAAGLKILLDRLSNHANAGPFLAKQLIQRLVTSNPSPAYVSRVASVFNNNGVGVRGDMKAVIKAVLLDNDARSASVATQPQAGRIREPLLRLTHLMRSLNASAPNESWNFGIPEWSFDRSKGTWQVPYKAPSVFNFYRPDYAPAGTPIGSAGWVAPEMQITHLSSVDDMQNFVLQLTENGGLTLCCSEAERNTYTLKLDYAPLLPLVATPDALLNELDRRFMGKPMSAGLRAAIKTEMASIYQDRSSTSGTLRGNTTLKLGRALYVLVSSPEFIVQK